MKGSNAMPARNDGLLYHIYKTHKRVALFNFNLHLIGTSERLIRNRKEEEILKNLFEFREERGFLTKKQIYLAQKLMVELNLW